MKYSNKLTAKQKLELFLRTPPDVFSPVKKALIIPGQNFLQPQIQMQRLCYVDEGYIIVNKDDWKKVIDLFKNHPEYIEQLGGK